MTQEETLLVYPNTLKEMQIDDLTLRVLGMQKLCWRESMVICII